jgi:hypothetical protein
MSSLYRHTQVGTLIIVALSVVIVLGLASGIGVGFRPVVLAVTVFLAVLLVCFGTLTVSVDHAHLVARFGPGPFRKKFPVSEIRNVRRVRNKWYYGWGIRLTPHGWLFNVSGFDAVEIELASGRKARIGTDEPRELVAAIRRAAGLGTESASS